VPVHRPGPLAGQETLITLIETSDQPRAMHDFNLQGASCRRKTCLSLSFPGFSTEILLEESGLRA
jgi:hypothetical protein